MQSLCQVRLLILLEIPDGACLAFKTDSYVHDIVRIERGGAVVDTGRWFTPDGGGKD